MKELLAHPLIRVLLVATAVAMCSFALRETAHLTQPVVGALGEVLLPLAIGFAIAYVITPAVDLLCRWGLRRPLAAFILFLGTALLGAGLVAVLVPVAIKQAVSLSQRTFQGEPYTDLNGNGSYDAGEPFVDLNSDRQRDDPLVGRGVRWVEEYQVRLRAGLRLGLDDRALAFVLLYDREVGPVRTELQDLLASARSGSYPEAPASASASAVPVWGAEWPGPAEDEVRRLASSLPTAQQEAFISRIAKVVRSWAERHDAMISDLREARRPGATSPSAGAKRLLEAWSRPLDAQERLLATGLATEMVAESQAGSRLARALMVELGGGEGGMGSQLISGLLTQMERSARGSLDTLPAKLGDLARSGFTSINDVFNFLLSVLLVPIYAFFLVLAMPRVRLGVKEYLPAGHREQIIRIAREIERVVAAFFRGRLTICGLCALVAVGGFWGLALFGIDVPFATLFGIAIGLATAIPLAGLLFAIPAAILTMLEPGAGPMHLVAVAGVYALVQGVEAVLIPLVMGNEVELNPVALIVALLLCGKLLGILGLILAVPIAATVRILAREFLWPRLKELAARPGGFWRNPVPPPESGPGAGRPGQETAP